MSNQIQLHPFIELVLDVHRNLSICGDEQGTIFLATSELMEDHPEMRSEKLGVMHVEDAWPHIRLPKRKDGVLSTEDEIVQIDRWSMPYGNGIYLVRAAFHRESMLWILSGEAEWRSPLQLELARNRILSTT